MATTPWERQVRGDSHRGRSWNYGERVGGDGSALGHQPTTKGADGLHRAATDGGRWRNNKFNASEHEEVPTRTHDGNTKSNIRCEHRLGGKR